MGTRTTKRTISVEDDVHSELKRQESPSRYISALVRHHLQWRAAHANLQQMGWRNEDLLAAAEALQGTHVVNTTEHRLAWMSDALHRYGLRAGVEGKWSIDADHWLTLCEALASNEHMAALLKVLVTELYLGNSHAEQTLRTRTTPMAVWNSLTRSQQRLAGALVMFGPTDAADLARALRRAGAQVDTEQLAHELANLALIGIARQDRETWSVLPVFWNLATSAHDIIVTQGVPSMQASPLPSRMPDPNGVYASASFMVQRSIPLASELGIEIGPPITYGRRGFMWPVSRGERSTWVFFSRVHGTILQVSRPDGEAQHCMGDLVTWSQPERSHRPVHVDVSLEQAFVEGLDQLVNSARKSISQDEIL